MQFVFLTHLKSLKEEVSDQLHELVDAMMINVIPLLMEMVNQSSEEDDTILFGEFDHKFWYFSIEFMLVDHFIEIPESIEEGLDNVGEHLFVLDSVTAENSLHFSE